MRHFMNREFAEAFALFVDVGRRNPQDAPARLFSSRESENYLQHGAPDDWTRVETINVKLARRKKFHYR
jgi:hypothetical protein